jgi:hypothetical protein
MIAHAASPATPGQAKPGGPDVMSVERRPSVVARSAIATGIDVPTAVRPIISSEAGSSSTAEAPPLAPVWRSSGIAGMESQPRPRTAAIQREMSTTSGQATSAECSVNGALPNGMPMTPPAKATASGPAARLDAMDLRSPSDGYTAAGEGPAGSDPPAPVGADSPPGFPNGRVTWSPPTRVAVATPPGGDRGPVSPVHSTGSASRGLDGATSRSVHVIPKSDALSVPMVASALRMSGAADSPYQPLSPSAMSTTGSVASSMRRQGRSSVHVIPKRVDPYVVLAQAQASRQQT